MSRHIRQDRIVEFLQILIAGELLGHGAGVALHRIGLVIQLCGRGPEAQGDLPDNELGGTVAGIGILAGFQTGTIRVAVCQRKGEQVFLLSGQLFILVSVALAGRGAVIVAVGQRYAMLDAEAVHEVFAIDPIIIVFGSIGTFGCIVTHFLDTGLDLITERVVLFLQTVACAENIAFRIVEGMISGNDGFAQIHGHFGSRGIDGGDDAQKHDNRQNCRHHALGIGFHSVSSVS